MLKKFLTILVLALTTGVALAVGEQLENTVISSGGNLPAPGATGTQIHTIIGQPVIGLSSGGSVTAELGALYGFGVALVEEAGVPAGTVPLFISRNGNNIEITWEVQYRNPQIFVLTGGGEGTFNNNYGAWTPVVRGGAVLSNLPGKVGQIELPSKATNKMVHKSQVGSGSAEVYYKALQAGVSNPGGKHPGSQLTYFESAPAVGKVNLTISRLGSTGWNFVQYPFADREINQTLYGNFSAGDELWVWDEQAKKYTEKRKFNGTNWEMFNLRRGVGYTFYRSQSQAVTATLLGQVDLTPKTTSISRVGSTGWNFIGLPFPGLKTVGQLVPQGAVAGDEFWLWSGTEKKFISKVKKSDWSGLELKLAKGEYYLYYRSLPNSYEWQMNW